MTYEPPLPPWDGGPDLEVPERYDSCTCTFTLPVGWRYDDRSQWHYPVDFPKDR